MFFGIIDIIIMNREYKVMGQQNFLKKNGIYYTSKSLAKTMIDCLNIDYTKEFTIIEPAVGEGHIFYLIVEEFLKKNQNKCQEKIKKKLENNFSAFDIREDAIKLCISRLDKLVSKYYNDLSVNWNIYIFDALDYYQKFDKQFREEAAWLPFSWKSDLTWVNKRIKNLDVEKLNLGTQQLYELELTADAPAK